MPLSGRRYAVSEVLAGAAVLSLLLAGCGKQGNADSTGAAAELPALPATLPMSNAPAQPAAYAPSATALPPRTIRTARLPDRRASYAYADQATDFSQSLGDGPPDYGFDYDGVQPWAWQAYDGSRVFMEPVQDGYRYYYYRQGADRPFFIRDPQAAYGYSGDELAAVYTPDGEIVSYEDYGPRLGIAAAFLWRAERLYEASRERRAVSAMEWGARENLIAESEARWAANRERQADWAAYHAEEAAQEDRYWAQEAERRDADAQRFAAWSRQDFRPAPPPRVIPAHWQQAGWAQDSGRYAPLAVAAAGAAALTLAAHHQRPEPAYRPLDVAPHPQQTAALRPAVDPGRGPIPTADQSAWHRHVGPLPQFGGSFARPDRLGAMAFKHGPATTHVARAGDFAPSISSRASPQPHGQSGPIVQPHALAQQRQTSHERQTPFADQATPHRASIREEQEGVIVHRGNAPRPHAWGGLTQDDRPAPERHHGDMAHATAFVHPAQAPREPAPARHEARPAPRPENHPHQERHGK